MFVTFAGMSSQSFFCHFPGGASAAPRIKHTERKVLLSRLAASLLPSRFFFFSPVPSAPRDVPHRLRTRERARLADFNGFYRRRPGLSGRLHGAAGGPSEEFGIKSSDTGAKVEKHGLQMSPLPATVALQSRDGFQKSERQRRGRRAFACAA